MTILFSPKKILSDCLTDRYFLRTLLFVQYAESNYNLMEKIRWQKLSRLGKTMKFLRFTDKSFREWWDLKSFAEIYSCGFPVLTNFPNRNFCDSPVFKILIFRRRKKMFILPCYYYYFCLWYSFNNLEITAITSITLWSIFLCISCFWWVSWLRLNIFHFSFQFFTLKNVQKVVNSGIFRIYFW